ncbi:MAG TPA: TIGR03560 family F420-dependent LLM class oxidoreductase [Myxococcota bacterium]
MRFSIWPGPHQDFADVLALALHAEATGWDGVWFADHFLPSDGDRERPTLECWTTLAALAARVPRVTLGSLVSGNTYRHPALLAKMAAGVDRISGGRLVLGIGAAWQESEHRAFGFAFPPLRERMDRLEEACRLLHGLLAGERVRFAGAHYVLEDAVLRPPPLQRPLPLLVGGAGRRTLRIAARWAQAWNAWGDPARLRDLCARLDAECERLGRDPATLRRTAVAVFALGEAPPAARVRGMPVVAGSPERLREAVAAYRAAGVDELVVPDFYFGGAARAREALDRLAGEVVAAFR